MSSDDEEDDDQHTAHSRRRTSSITNIRPLTPLEIALNETTARLTQQLQLKVHRRVSDFERALLDIEQEEQRDAEAATQLWKQEFAALAATDRKFEQRRAQDREQKITSLRTVHEQQAQQAADNVAELEAVARREAEEREQAIQKAAAVAAAVAAAAKAQKDQAAAAVAAAQLEKSQQETQRLVQLEAAAAAAVATKKAQEQAAIAATPATTTIVIHNKIPKNKEGILSITPSAAQFHQRCAEKLAAALETVRPFVEDRAMRDIKRPIDKFITLNVQQISATLDQVRNKAQALATFISRHHDIQRTYALVTLASKLMSQCEVQITRLHAFAFPLAEVAVAVGAAHPDFLDILVARLHDACPLSVPMYYGFRAGGNEVEYLRLMKYKIPSADDAAAAAASPQDQQVESTDEYLGRMQGYVMLYAAITQSDNPANPHGLRHAWEYLARLLNGLPPNRVTAAALDAFLKVTGYKLYAVYKGQFMKLLKLVEGYFLGELMQSNDPDARAVFTRLQIYFKTRQFQKPPEGREMPQFDSSSYDRA